MTKKIISIMLCLVTITVCFCGCSSNSNNNEVTTKFDEKIITDDTGFKVSYTQSDSIDPFKAKTLNNQVLSSLVFESLFDIDDSYKVQPNIASEYEYTNKKTLAVTINLGNTFSDGSTVDAQDVVYSAKAAMKSPAYGTALSAISSVNADSESIIVFHLKYADPYAVNLLTFPIASVDDDENGYPVGSGRYSFASNGSDICLKANVTDSFSPQITTVNLVNIAAADSIDNAVNIGNISFAFRDMSQNSAKRMTAAKKPVQMNNLVYIGLNNFSSITSNPNIRKAISLAIDRSTIAKSAYADYATPAKSIYNPKFELASDTELFSDTADTSAAKQAIAQSGIDSKDLKLSILVNKNHNKISTANLVKSQLEAVGFTVTIDVEETKTYKSKAENVIFDIYIGETKLADDMCLNPFLTSSGKTHYGINIDQSACASSYKKYLSGDAELGEFILSFSEEMPFIPLVYHKGMICYSKSLSGDMQGFYGNYFANIQEWYFDN